MDGWMWLVLALAGLLTLLLIVMAVASERTARREHEIKLATIEAEMFEKALAEERGAFTRPVPPVPDLLGRSFMKRVAEDKGWQDDPALRDIPDAEGDTVSPS